MIVYMGCIYTSTPDFSYTLYIHASTLAKGCIGGRYTMQLVLKASQLET